VRLVLAVLALASLYGSAQAQCPAGTACETKQLGEVVTQTTSIPTMTKQLGEAVTQPMSVPSVTKMAGYAVLVPYVAPPSRARSRIVP
jgi:hypothetical protein